MHTCILVNITCTSLLAVGTNLGSDPVQLSNGISGSWSLSISCAAGDSEVQFSVGRLASDVTDSVSSSSSDS